MLLELRIENLLLIERAELRLGPGLNAITGETGAGKTILAHSLDLIIGGKARPQIVRPGAGEAYVEGVFELPEGLLEDPELAEIAERLPEDASELALGRRVGTSGRTSAFVQGRAASAEDLRALGSRLLAFYGQHEHRKLTLASAQLETLDGFAGEKHLERLRALPRGAQRGGRGRVASWSRSASARARASATWTCCATSWRRSRSAEPDAAEEGELAPERERLRHAESLRGAAAEALAAVAGSGEEGGGASEAVAVADSALLAQEGVDPELDKLAERARGLTVELQELAAELRSYAEGIEAEPGRLQQVEERLDVLDRLKRKHGGSIESVLAHAERCRTEIARIEGAGERTEELERRRAKAARERGELAAAAERDAGPRPRGSWRSGSPRSSTSSR